MTAVLLDVTARICSEQYVAFLCSSQLAFSQCVLLASIWCIHIIILMQLQLGRCFKQGAICNLRGHHLKLADQFPCLGSNISSTESDVNIYLAKVLNACQSHDLSDKIKWYICIWKCLWHHVYCCRKWAQHPKFRSCWQFT